MVPSRVAGGMAQSSSSSGIFFQGDGQYLVAENSQLSSNFGNSLPGNTRANFGPVSGDVSNAVLNSMASSGPSAGESSLVTDANSGLSASPHLQRSASINTESYMRLPASPMSFSSNNISISGSSVMDGSSVVQQSSNQDSVTQQHQGASSATSLPRMGQVQFPGGARVSNSFNQVPTNVSQLHKKPRLELKHEDIVQQQVLQQLLQRQDTMHLQNSNPQLQALIHQQRLRQQEQQLLQTMPQIQRIQLFQQQQQQQQQLQLRQELLMQKMPPASAVKRPYDGSVCSRRLMQYLYHQRQRPADNTIAYWKKFVAEYYSPRAKHRWCLSLYDDVGYHSLGVFPQSAMNAWKCDICGSKSGRGFEATFEVLPRLNEIKFGSGVIEELLFLDLPREYRFPSGIMMLEYAKAVQESVYEQLRVVREGQLRIFFTPDLKILSWEFCVRRHEELLPRRLVAPQVNQLLQVAQKCQNTISLSGASGVPQQELQENSLRVVTAGRQLARSLELQSLNDLGFSKTYVRSLQIADVLNSMKDLVDFCGDKNVGPIEGLKSFPRCRAASNVQIQKMQELNQKSGHQGLAMHPAMANYQNLLMRHNSPNNSTQQQEGSSPSSQATPYGSSGTLPGILHNSPVNSFSGRQVQQQQQSQSSIGNGLMHQSQSLPSQNNQTLHQQMVQQYLQEMSRKNNGGVVLQQQALPKQNPGGGTSVSGPGCRNSGKGPAEVARFKSASSSSSSMSESTAAMGFGQKESDLTHGLHSPDDAVADVANELTENGFFSSDIDDFDFNWE